MLKKAYPLVMCIFMLTLCAQADQKVSGLVSGVWESGETIRVIDHISIRAGDSLIIEPGVRVEFTGPFEFRVYGLLQAVGREDAMIVFTRAFPTKESKWCSINFLNADDASILEYCDISYARKEGDEWHQVRGGAIYAEYCSPTIRYCHLHHNFAHNENWNGTGGGIGLEEECNSLIEFNHIHDNIGDNGGGIYLGRMSYPVVRYNHIHNNRAKNGGGIHSRATSEISGNLIEENIAEGNGGGGIFFGSVWPDYAPVAYNNLIINNSATADKEHRGGGGIYARYVELYLYNNTLVGNQAVRGGGIFVMSHSYPDPHPQLLNTILWNNQAILGPQIFLYEDTGSYISVDYCDIEGDYYGYQNIDLDPEFIDSEGGDFHLRHTSPCRDTGTPSWIKIPDTDFEGDDRLAETNVDMGADEFHPHFYFTGDAVPSGSITLKLVNLPDTAPLVLCMGSGMLTDPIPTVYGDWYLEEPFKIIQIGTSIPRSGFAEFRQVIPSVPEDKYFFQALMGDQLSNLCVVEIDR